MNELPQINAGSLAEKLRNPEGLIILDVREAWELDLARINDQRVINLPLSLLNARLLDAFPPELRDEQAQIIVMCHHGVRSSSVVNWMLGNGWKNVFNLTGGIAAYAAEADSTVGFY